MFETPVSALIRRPVARIDVKAPLKEAIRRLREESARCLVVVDGPTVVGLFTDRDAVEKCFTPAVHPDTPVEQVMESPLITIPSNTPVGDALHLLDAERIRHLPLVDEDGTLRGLIRGRDILDYIAEALPQAVLNQPPDAAQAPVTREGG